MEKREQKRLKNKTIEELDFSKYDNGNNDSESHSNKHETKSKSQFSQAFDKEGSGVLEIERKRMVSFKDLTYRPSVNITSHNDLSEKEGYF